MARIFNRASIITKRRELRKEMTPAENKLWLKLRAKQFLELKWRRQYSVGPYVVDFYCPAIKLAVELDGDSHFGGGAEERDARRQAYIEKYGIRVVRFVNHDIHHHMPIVLDAIAEAVQDRSVLIHTNRRTCDCQTPNPPVSPLEKGGK